MPKQILLVENCQHDVEFTILALQRCGIPEPIIHADDGAVGLWHLATNPQIGLVLLDLKLRTVDGFEFLKIVRSDLKYVSLPIFVLSASTAPEDRLKAAQLGASGFFMKTTELHTVLGSCLESLKIDRADA